MRIGLQEAKAGSPINQADVYSVSKSVNNKRLVLLHLVGNQYMVGSGEIHLCVCLMGEEHYALLYVDVIRQVGCGAWFEKEKPGF